MFVENPVLFVFLMSFLTFYFFTLIFLSCFYIRADFRTVCLFGYQIIFSGSLCYFSRYIHVFWIFYKKKYISLYNLRLFKEFFYFIFWILFVTYISVFFSFLYYSFIYFVLNNLRILLMFLLVFFQMLLNVFILINDLNLNCD